MMLAYCYYHSLQKCAKIYCFEQNNSVQSILISHSENDCRHLMNLRQRMQVQSLVMLDKTFD